MKSLLAAAAILLLGGVFGKPMTPEDNLKSNQVNIINGAYTTINNYPFDVSFLVENNIWGAGVILNKNWILTTAFNCMWVDPSFISVRAGSSYWTENGQVYQAEKCIMHPKYNGTLAYDIALLKVTGDIIHNGKTIKYANLPKKSNYTSAKLAVSGWGVRSASYKKETRLQKTKQTVWSDADCGKSYNLTGTNFCAYNPNAGPCIFDFGAPLSFKKQIVGLYQGSTNCSDPKTYPALYTDVYQFKAWITEIITSNGGSLDESVDGDE